MKAEKRNFSEKEELHIVQEALKDFLTTDAVEKAVRVYAKEKFQKKPKKSRRNKKA